MVQCISCDDVVKEGESRPYTEGTYFCIECAPCDECRARGESNNVGGVPLCVYCEQEKWEDPIDRLED